MPLRHRTSPPAGTSTPAAAPAFSHLGAPALSALAALAAARVDFVLVGSRADPLTIVPAPYARNLARLERVRAGLGEGGGALRVQHELSHGYQELLYEARAAEVAAGLSVQVATEAALALSGGDEIRIHRQAPSHA